MKLSEAILLGAMMKPQGGIWGYPHTSCGLQAALDAVGEDGKYPAHESSRVWPWLNKNIECPWCVHEHAGYDIIGRCLNDGGKWTRQKIAKWVASIEPQDIIEPAQPQSLVERVEITHGT